MSLHVGHNSELQQVLKLPDTPQLSLHPCENCVASEKVKHDEHKRRQVSSTGSRFWSRGAQTNFGYVLSTSRIHNILSPSFLSFISDLGLVILKPQSQVGNLEVNVEVCLHIRYRVTFTKGHTGMLMNEEIQAQHLFACSKFITSRMVRNKVTLSSIYY